MKIPFEHTVATQDDIAHLEKMYADPACKFYRLEVTDDTQKQRIALGNPIWNEA